MLSRAPARALSGWVNSSPMKKQRVVVGLSGGVDSAVTTHLLKAMGH